MSPELIGILSVGATLAGMMLRMGGRLGDVDQRLARLEDRLNGLECLLSRLVPQADSGD